MDRSSVKANAKWVRLVVVIIASIAAQVPLFAFYQSQTGVPDHVVLCDEHVAKWARVHAPEGMRGGLIAAIRERCEPRDQPLRGVAMRVPQKEEKKPDTDPPIPEDAQVVEVPKQDVPDDAPPVDTKYLAEQNTRTEKETRSKVAKPSTQKSQGKVSVEDPSPVQAETSTSPSKTVTTRSKETEVQLADATQKLPDADHGQAKPDTIVERGKDAKILLPTGTDEAAMANLQALSGDFTSSDYLPDVDEGGATVLNANKYRYADFFNRVKRAVERQWHPAEVYRRRDPTGRAYGVKDRYTLLRVTLDPQGNLVRLLTTRDSGLDFMDEEARGAFSRAAPFPNPPDGLVSDSGNIVFEFGFYFEITAGRYGFQWKRL
ncbi:MAG: TonB C-terminal domain-containing protein [Myxococcales bacterium]|nr:TonB C-terminal domain-containing protein [Myxococcales bacterium]MCB9733331.1 TonB C-terminal domain-containing protein [Deltaproteobacteria bacterium]